jgi:hypothetical protein
MRIFLGFWLSAFGSRLSASGANRETGLRRRSRQFLVEAHKRPAPGSFSAPDQRSGELQRVRCTDTVLIGKAFGQRTDSFRWEHFVPRASKLVQESDGGRALCRGEVTLAHEPRERASRLSGRTPPHDHFPELYE